jgi:hypothetical protein
MRIAWTATALVLLLLVASGCAPGPNQLVGTPDDGGRVAGFWHGLWHGFIALFTSIVSLFADRVQVYDVHNNGNWYDLGFLLGLLMFFGGGGEAGRRSRCR